MRRVAAVLRAGGEEIRRFLADLVAIAEISPNESPEPEVLQRFADYDDAWWRGLMRDHLRRGGDATVEPWLRLFLYRTPGPVSLWKRPAEVPVNNRYAWNRRLPDPKQDFGLAASWETIRAALRQQGVLLERVPFRPSNAAPADEDESVLQVRTDAGPVALTRISPLTSALSEAWAEELHVFAFADGQAQLSAQDGIDQLSPALKPLEPG